MSIAIRSIAASLRTLLASAVDYAGLYPPASLAMVHCVANFANYLHHPHSWLLGRFVLPASRLDEFLEARERVAPVDEAKDDAGPVDAIEHPWRLSAILSGDFAHEIEVIKAFNHGTHGALIEAVELCVSTPEEIKEVRRLAEPGIRVFFEVRPERAAELLPLISHEGSYASPQQAKYGLPPHQANCGLVGDPGLAGDPAGDHARGHAGCYAKLRTGGVSAEAIPSVEVVVDFLVRCAEFNLPFKATAGLHHALRCVAPLTYEAESPRATMYGFLNLFTAAAIEWSAQKAGGPAPREMLAACLADSDRKHWWFTDHTLTWRGVPEPPHPSKPTTGLPGTPLKFQLGTLAEMRSKFALSFGSCSFEEPIDELRALELL